jgi:hypothetical protein
MRNLWSANGSPSEYIGRAKQMASGIPGAADFAGMAGPFGRLLQMQKLVNFELTLPATTTRVNPPIGNAGKVDAFVPVLSVAFD